MSVSLPLPESLPPERLHHVQPLAETRAVECAVMAEHRPISRIVLHMTRARSADNLARDGTGAVLASGSVQGDWHSYKLNLHNSSSVSLFGIPLGELCSDPS